MKLKFPKDGKSYKTDVANVQKRYSREWIKQRSQAIQVRKELTDAL